MSPFFARAGVLAALLGAVCAAPVSAQSQPLQRGVMPTPFPVPGAPVAATPLPSPSPTPAPSPAASPLTEIGRTVVTGDRRPESLARTTRPTFVVDRATIESFGSRTVGDALFSVPGMDLFSYGAFGAQIGYGIRGTTSAQTLILRDGVPITPGSNGIIDLGSVPAIGLARIEVVESGSSTLYGSNATGGVINLISATGRRAYARISDGSLGDRDAAVEAGFGGLDVSFERHVATNFYDFPAFAYADGTFVASGTRANADAQQSAARVSYRANLGPGWTARLSAGDDAIRIGVPGSLAFGATADSRQATARSDAQLDIGRTIGSGALDLTLSGSKQNLPYEGSIGSEDDTFDGRSQASLRYTRGGTFSDVVAGIDVARETALLTFSYGTPPPPPAGHAESQAAAYVQYGFSSNTTTRFVAGLRGENDAPRGGALAPSFGVTLGLGAARLSANVAESFRVPTLIDLYYPGYANPDLLPERLGNYDATLAFPSAGGGISIGYFGRNGTNLITLDPTTYAPVNAARVSVNGLALTAATVPYNHVSATASVTNLYRAQNTATGTRLPNTPPIVATLGLERPFDGGAFAFGARVRIVGANADITDYTSGGMLNDPYASYTDADAYARWRFTRDGIVTVRVKNLGGERYAPIFGYPAPGRTFEVELSTR